MGIVVSDATLLSGEPLSAKRSAVFVSTADDSKVVSWIDDRGWLVSQRYDADGSPLGDTIVLDKHGHGDFPDEVYTTSDGGWIESYLRDDSVDGKVTTNLHVVRYDVNGNRLSEDVEGWDRYPQLVKLAGDGYAVVSYDQPPKESKLFARFFNAEGEQVANKVLAHDFEGYWTTTLANGDLSVTFGTSDGKETHLLVTPSGEILNSLVGDANERIQYQNDGGYVIKRFVGDNGFLDEIYDRYDADGNLLSEATGAKYASASHFTGNEYTLTLSGGNQAVFWTAATTGKNLYMHVLDSEGNVLVEDQTIGSIHNPYLDSVSTLALSNGDWLASWGGHTQVFNADGTKNGKPFTSAVMGQVAPVEATSDGGWEYTYIATGPDGADHLYSRTFHVGDAKNPPVAMASSGWLNEDAVYKFGRNSFKTSDYDGDAITGIVIQTLPDIGTLRLNGAEVHAGDTIATGDINHLTWTPAANFNGDSAGFTFEAVDATGAVSTEPARFSFTVAPVDDAPTGGDNTITILEDQVVKLTTDDFPFADIDGDRLGAVLIAAEGGNGQMTASGKPVGMHGTRSIFLAGGYSHLMFTPGENETGNHYATFKFKVIDNSHDPDGQHTDKTWHTLTINVLPVNDAPISENTSVWVNAGDHFDFIDQLFQFQDVENDKFKSIIIDSLPSFGTLELAGHAVKVGEEIRSADLEKLSFDFSKDQIKGDSTNFTFSVLDNGGTANGGSDTEKAPSVVTFDISNDRPVIRGTTHGDHLNGNDSRDILMGGAGNDVLDGGSSNDLLIGGSGADVFVMRPATGTDSIADFDVTQDKIDLRTTSIKDFSQLSKQEVYVNGVNTAEVGYYYLVDHKYRSETFMLPNVDVHTLTADNFIFG